MAFLRKKPPDHPPQRLIVGLGNPGPEYKGTRHNVGFEVIEILAARHKVPVKTMQLKAMFGTGDIESIPVGLVKPLTFMNLSGQAVAGLAKKWGILPGNILVITDDLDLPSGKVRMRISGSSGGHNGHKSIIQSLGTDAYPRIKIGIGKGKDETIAHVLSKFHPDEREDIRLALERAVDGIEAWLRDGIERAMNQTNTG